MVQSSLIHKSSKQMSEEYNMQHKKNAFIPQAVEKQK